MAKLPRPIFMLVTDRRLAGGEDALVTAVGQAVEAGVNVVQLREKDMDTQGLSMLAGRLRDVIGGRALLLVNSDAAVAGECDGLHLPEDADFTRPDGGGLVGRSVHSVDAPISGGSEGADYFVAGPVWETASHPGEAPAGLRLVSDVANAVDVPVIAIGGITAERVPEAMASGASGVAVVRAILGAESPGGAATALWDALTAVRSGERR